jgi:glutamate carboxypeptidase
VSTPSSPTDAARLHAAWDRRGDAWVSLLRRLVDQGSYSDDLAGVDAVRRMLVPELEATGASVEEIARPSEGGARPRAAHLVARWSAAGSGPRTRALLIGHLDTVHPPGVGRVRLEQRGDVLLGPGVGDIKGGVVAMLGALRLLSDEGLPSADVTIFLNSDEEVGSHSSRGLLRELAASCDVALGFEPAFCPTGEPVEAPSRVQHVTERKGCGRMELILRGVAAHSGGAHHLGVSAVEALARKTIEMHALTDDARGITTNVGLVHGGRAANTVAPEARAEIDFRYRTWDDGLATWARLSEIALRPERVNPRVDTPVTAEIEPGGGALWPPLRPTPESLRLSRLVVGVSGALGFEAEAITRGGASDAAHAAAAGLPAICGLGPVASGIHTDDERSSVSGLRRASVTAAALLSSLLTWKEARS